MNKCKALTLYQPWAQAIACGLKRYETRGRLTHYRGRLLVHASKRWADAEHDFWSVTRNGLLLDFDGVTPDQHRGFCGRPPLGCIVAVADLVDCRFANHTPGLTPLERHFGNFVPGRYAWELANVVRLKEPVPCRGMQGLWTPSEETMEKVEAQL